MLTNKYINLAINFVMAVAAWAATVDWSAVGGTKVAGGVTVFLTLVKILQSAVAPAPGATVKPTGGSVITHTS